MRLVPFHLGYRIQNPEPVDPISLINISGTPELQGLIRLLYIEYRDIISNTLSSQLASIPPLDLVVQDPKWRASKNRQPPRPQSAANQKEITRQLNILSRVLLRNPLRLTIAKDF